MTPFLTRFAATPSRTAKSLPSSPALPRISPFLLSCFTWYSRQYLRRHFHSLRISQAGLSPQVHGWPLAVYANHASWWDPLVCLLLKDEFFSDRTVFAPMDAAMLDRYRFFRRLGFFRVQQSTIHGAKEFLRTAETVLQSPQALLALTPQGRFADVRERPPHLASGLGHLPGRVMRAVFVPLAVEYVFWEERLPEILVRFGDPLKLQTPDCLNATADDWTALFEEKLSETQNALATEAKRRNPADFRILLHGGSGQGGIYDCWRSWKAKWHGKTFRKEHGIK